MVKKVHLIGTGGVAKELIGFISCEKEKRYEILGCWGPQDFSNNEFNSFYKGSDEDLKEIYQEDEFIIIAVSSPSLKEKIVSSFSKQCYSFTSYIHPSVIISDFSNIETGCIIGPNAVLTGNVSLHKFVYLSYSSIVGHDSSIGEFSTIYPLVEVSGNCNVGKKCVFGLKSACFPGLTLTDETKVDAGSILRKSTDLKGIYSGNPAELKKIID